MQLQIDKDDEDSQDVGLMKRGNNGALTKTMAPSCPTLGAGGNHPKEMWSVEDNIATNEDE